MRCIFTSVNNQKLGEKKMEPLGDAKIMRPVLNPDTSSINLGI